MMAFLGGEGWEGRKNEERKMNSFIQIIMELEMCQTTEGERPGMIYNVVFKF